MAGDSKAVFDGFAAVPEGMDGATPPESRYMDGRTAYAVNVSHRGGFAHPRPGWVRLPLANDVTGEPGEALASGRFQGAGVYYPDAGEPELVFGVGGYTYTVGVESLKVRHITPSTGRGSSTAENWWWCQAENYFIRNTGVDPALIYDGTTARCPEDNELDAGGPLAYAWGRIWYATIDRNGYRATDLVWGNGNRSDVLKETENEYLGDGDFAIPGNVGLITAIAVPGQLENGIGQGPVHVFCERGVFTNNAPVDRDQWATLRYPIQTVSLVGKGAVGAASTVVVNGDIFFRSHDGVHSYFLARRDFSQWGNRDISREIAGVLGHDHKGLLGCGSAVVWRNRLLMTAWPSECASGSSGDRRGVVHHGIVSLDMDVFSTMKSSSPPAWDGVWTGARVHKLLTVQHRGEVRCVAFVRHGDGDALELWEMREDADVDLGSKRIPWLVIPRKMDFGVPWTMKRLQTAELFVDDLSGQVDFEVALRTDDNPTETAWARWSECAVSKTCSTAECASPAVLWPQYRTRMRLPRPKEDCLPSTGRPASTGYKFQPVIRVTGRARIKGMRLEAVADRDLSDPKCDGQTVACVASAGCPEMSVEKYLA